MFKVICIDAKGTDVGSLNGYKGYPLVEGEPYTVIGVCPYRENYYILSERVFTKNGVPAYYNERRFIPLSNIDETQLTSTNVKENVV